MDRHTAPPFRAPTGKPRTHVQEQCAGFSLLSPILEIWSSSDRWKNRPKANADDNGCSTERRAPSLIGQDPNQEWVVDRCVPPWFSEQTDIEWAVHQWLRSAHPQIHGELMLKACEHAGLLEPDGDEEDGQAPSS